MRLSLRSFTPRRRLPLPSSKGSAAHLSCEISRGWQCCAWRILGPCGTYFETGPVQQGCGEHSVKLLVLDASAARRWMDRDGFKFNSCRR
jgi:hypothetical protein